MWMKYRFGVCEKGRQTERESVLAWAHARAHARTRAPARAHDLSRSGTRGSVHVRFGWIFPALLPHSTRALWVSTQGSAPQSHCVTVFVLSWPAHRPCQVIMAVSYSTLLLAGAMICLVICKSNMTLILLSTSLSKHETSINNITWTLHAILHVIF